MLPGVSKTAILTLRARADEHERPDRIFADPVAADWWTRVTWPAELDTWYGADAQNTVAFRAGDIDRILSRWVESYASPISVTELGAGLSTRRRRLAELPIARWVDVDLPEVVELRRSWGVPEPSVAASVLDFAWMDALEGEPSSHVFVAEGLLYYLPRAGVDALFLELRRRFAGSVVIMDVVGANDFGTLLRNTQAAGSPVLWKLERDFEDVLDDFGLRPVEGFEPDRLMHDMLERYWERFEKKLRGAIYFAMSSQLVWGGRSGNVLGRL